MIIYCRQRKIEKLCDRGGEPCFLYRQRSMLKQYVYVNQGLFLVVLSVEIFGQCERSLVEKNEDSIEKR